MQFSPTPAALALCFFLTACGGGGGGGGGDAPAPAAPNQPPAASFTVSASTLATFEQVSFDASASTDDAAITNYEWTFGDGGSASGRVVTHRYSATGDYTVKLVVSDAQGESHSSQQTVGVRAPLSISGTISASEFLRVDGDVNDVSSQFSPNNTRLQAQSLPNPVRLIGFASTVGTLGTGDRFAVNPDPLDYYIADLVAGQSIGLQVADFDPANPSRNDIDLYLLDMAGSVLLSSESNTETEGLTVPADGTYMVLVEATSGISKYVLTIGNNASNSNSQSVDFVPNQVIVKFSDSATPDSTTASLIHDEYEAQLQQAPGQALGLVKTRSAKANRRLQERLQNSGKALRRLRTYAADYQESYAELEADERYATLKLLKQLRRRKDVEIAEPNYRVRSHLEPNDSLYPRQRWHYNQVNLPAAWEMETGITFPDPAVYVAVIDTGVLRSHPDLGANVLNSGYDFISDPARANDGNGIDPDPTDPGDQGLPDGRGSYHGTHVAGTVAALSNNGRGVSGVSWGAWIMPLRALGVGGGTTYDITQAVLYAARLNNASGTLPPRRADIINMSLGCSNCYSQSLQDAITAARSAGVIVVASAGNNNSPAANYPAAYSGVVAVAAVDSIGNKANYSNFGSHIDIAAPGGDSADRNGDGHADLVISTWGDDSGGSISHVYAGSEGTSMAAPHVAGIAALMKATYPAMTPAEFDAAIASGSISNDVLSSGFGWDNETGHGIIDARKAVEYAINLAGGVVPGSVVATPNAIDVASVVVWANLNLAPAGSNPPQVTLVSVDQTWGTISETSVDGDGYGNYRLSIDRTGLTPAIYDATITVDLSDGRQLEIPVLMSVHSGTSSYGYAGYQYVLLVDNETGNIRYQTSLDESPPGEYRFEFNGVVAPGSYLLFSGSDIDNNLLICQSGETCAAYPTLTNVEPLNVSASLTDIDLELFIESSLDTNQANTTATEQKSRAIRRLPE